MPSVAWAMVVKDLKLTVRHPVLLVLSVLVPTLFVGIFALVIHTSTTVPVGVQQTGEGPATGGLLNAIRNIGSVEGPYYKTMTGTPEALQEAYERRQLPGLILLPGDSDAAGVSGDAAVRIRVFNSDSDVTKNLHLRLERAVRTYNRETNPVGMVSVEEATVYPRETPMGRYFGSALLMFAVLYVAMVNTGALIAEEWELKTAKGIVLSPSGAWPFILGKLMAALLVGTVGIAVVFVAIALLLQYPLARLTSVSWIYLALIGLYGAAIGALLGTRFRSSLLLVPASAVISIAHLLLCGFESYIRGFAHDGLLALMWRGGSVWPVSWLTDDIRTHVEQGSTLEVNTMGIAIMAALTTLLMAVAARSLRARLAFTQGM